MAEVVVMPRMNLTMESGLLAYWYKKVGDTVSEGEALCSIENEKETEELLSPAAGVIVKVWAAAEESYNVGIPLCLIAAVGEDIASVIARVEVQGVEKRAALAGSTSEAPEIPVAGSFRILPKTRNFARQKGIAVEELQAYFGNTAITESHIMQYLAHKESGQKVAPDLGSGRRLSLSPMRKAIAETMTLSCQKTARLTNFMEVDMTAAMEKLAQLKLQGIGYSLTALVIKACATALPDHSIVNTALDEEKEEIVFRNEVNIGFAVDITGGLVVPVIKNADKKTVAEITQAVVRLAKAAETSALTRDDRSGGTFTVSNVGMLGIDSFTPIIRYPETAILGIGQIKTLPRYLADDYTIVYPRKIMKIALSYDHRVIDGAPASRFLLSVRALLEDINNLL